MITVYAMALPVTHPTSTTGTASELTVVERTQVAVGVVTHPDAPLLKVRQQSREHHRAVLAFERRPLIAPEEDHPMFAGCGVACDVLDDDVALEIGLDNGR